jgi:tyrosine-protein kinase Etk/Wzc
MNLLKQSRGVAASAGDEIHLSEIVAVMREHRLMIALVTAVVLVLGAAYALFGTPVYRADALIQVDDDSGTDNINQKLGDLASLFQSKATADAEIELVRSRMVIGKAVRSLHLDISAKPHYFPVVGAWIARHRSKDRAVGPIFGLSRFAWGGEKLEVTQFDVPEELYDERFVIVAGEGQRFELRDSHGDTLFQGQVGKLARHMTPQGPLDLTIEMMTASPGTMFDLARASTQLTIEDLQKVLDVREKVKQSGIIAVALEGTDAARIAATVNAVARIYVQRNVDGRFNRSTQHLESA